MSDRSTTEQTTDNRQSAPLHAILEALDGLRFGSVTVVVQDGVVVQVERVEKRRISRKSPRAEQC